MNKVIALHNEAMDYAERALIARNSRDLEKADELFRLSLSLELNSIATLDQYPRQEPTYSVLHRSAATLALDCQDYNLAERLIAKALSADIPHEIGEELRDLLEQVYFHRHLQLRGVDLDDDEVQLSLSGSGVGFGIVQSFEFLQRVEDTSKILYRIVERRNNRPFREKGAIKKVVKNDYELFISVPRASSFAVTLKLGKPSIQPKLPEMSDAPSIVDEFMELVSMVNDANHKGIEERIPDPAYRTNFIHLAKRLAPDGTGVRLVGFTSKRAGKEKYVKITRPRKEIIVPPPNDGNINDKGELVTVRGILKLADATNGDGGRIQVVDENNARHTIKVPEGMLNDIVKPLWDSPVIITGIRVGKNILLEDIDSQ